MAFTLNSRRRLLIAVLAIALIVSGCRRADENSADGGDSVDDEQESQRPDTDDQVDDGGEGTDPDPSESAGTDAPEIVAFDASFDSQACDGSLPLELSPRCGVVEVPMDWATGEGTVSLAVAVFPSTAEAPADDPVVYLEGGPGGHALETLTFSTEDLLAPSWPGATLLCSTSGGPDCPSRSSGAMR